MLVSFLVTVTECPIEKCGFFFFFNSKLQLGSHWLYCFQGHGEVELTAVEAFFSLWDLFHFMKDRSRESKERTEDQT